MTTKPDDIHAAFEPNPAGLELGLRLLLSPPPASDIPTSMSRGVGPEQALSDLAAAILPRAAALDHPGFFAHMDPPTPWITWVASQWAARLNQNLLHSDTGEIARVLENRVIDTLAPIWGMDGGHMVPGSTVANLTALWAARTLGSIDRVAASEDAHLSIPKSAHILGLQYQPVRTDPHGRMLLDGLGSLDRAAVVLTAGTTSIGAIDPLDRLDAAWVHVDAAWAGPLRLSDRWRHLLAGIEHADSVAVSAHKWLHQPKESALILFRDSATAHEAVRFGASYLSVPNIGVLGSHGFSALPLAATLYAYGLEGLGAWVDHGMNLAIELVDLIRSHESLEQWGEGPGTGVVAWRPRRADVRAVQASVADAFVSITNIGQEPWLRSVAANPLARPSQVVDAVLDAADST